MKILYTIGYTKKSLKQFIQLLKSKDIKKIIDIRLRNTSQLAGFAKADDLKYILETYEKIQYKYIPTLAPTDEILDNYKQTKNWDIYSIAFNELMKTRAMEKIIAQELNDSINICLLCAEDIPSQCHRRLVAEYYKKFDAEISIIHLTKRDLKMNL